MEISGISKALRRRGYKWLPRAQKRKYSPVVMQERLDFSTRVVALGPRRLRKRLRLAMDGVVLPVPPEDPTARSNHCHGAETHMWRKPSEAADPTLAGQEPYVTQVPPGRAVALWGGVSGDGFAEVAVHRRKKFNHQEWCEVVRTGKLVQAVRAVNPDEQRGPWTVLCDNESFLWEPHSRAAHRRANIVLWKMPPRSPDLNPVEKYWSWLRRALLRLDLHDLRTRRPPLGRSAYVARVRAVNRSQRAQRVAGNCARGLLKVCREVKLNGGAASRA